jgi:hypothetical protein
LKRGLVGPRKIVPFEVNYFVKGGDQPIFYKVFFPQKTSANIMAHQGLKSKQKSKRG